MCAIRHTLYWPQGISSTYVPARAIGHGVYPAIVDARLPREKAIRIHIKDIAFIPFGLRWQIVGREPFQVVFHCHALVVRIIER